MTTSRSFLQCLLYLPCILWMSGNSYGQEPLSQRTTRYEMDVTLDHADRMLYGETSLLWINPSTDTVPDLQFHLYYNAFKSNQTTWMREDEFYMTFSGGNFEKTCPWAWSVIDQMTDQEGHDLTGGFSFLRPEEENPYDETVLRVALPRPVLPYDSVHVAFKWKARIPHAMIRTGYNKDFYFFAQWFPKLGVYEPAGMRYATSGGWNCHQYHANSEYYADFGVYEVDLTVPTGFVVGGSGILTDTRPAGQGKSRWSFRAEDVIDFAWAASPHFEVIRDRRGNVDLTLYMYPEHRMFEERYLDAIHHAMDYMETYVGNYPYPVMRIVDAPIHGIFAGAMEYPNLILTFSTPILPQCFRSVETLVVHEFVHQYFMQMVATNEQEEPWMDEGITSYYEAEIMDRYYGEKTSMIYGYGFRVGNLEYTRHEYFGSRLGRSVPCNLPSWEYEQGAYSMASYNKPALWLKTLEGLTGKAVMEEVMRTYFDRWKFGHPCTRDFVDVANDVISARLPDRWPEGMDWYFSQVIGGTAVCDYSVESITNELVPARAGFLEDTVECTIGQDNPGEPLYDAKVILQRDGGLRIPVDVEVYFEDGSKDILTWDGPESMSVLRYRSPARVTGVVIDPGYLNCLDYNYINNSRTIAMQRRGLLYYFTRWLHGAQQAMETISMLM